jgi:S1-C subfamily serine protease
MLLTAGLLFGMVLSMPRSANADTPEVIAARDGVLCVSLYGTFPRTGTEVQIASGSGFLISEETFVTCAHVVRPWGDANPYEFADMKIKVHVLADVTVDATIVEHAYSASMDIAVLRLSQEIGNRVPLQLADSDKLTPTTPVWALGFPAIVNEFDQFNINSFTPADVTISAGAISKLAILFDNNNYVQHSADISGGNSGGPLVNEAGAVVGINSLYATASLGDGTRYSSAVNGLKQMLESLKIPYDPAPATPSPSVSSSSSSSSQSGELTPSDKTELDRLITEYSTLASDLSGYTDESASRFTSALDAARAVSSDPEATSTQINDARSNLNNARNALAEKPTLPLALIIGIAGAVVVVIIVIVILIMRSRKKKKVPVPVPGAAAAPALQLGASQAGQGSQPLFSPTSFPDSGSTTSIGTTSMAPSAYQPPTSAMAPAAYQPAPNSFDVAGGGETTVLNPSVGETSLLGAGGSHAGAATAMLRRVSNGEKVRIDRQDFTIGKERRKVNYVIPDNGSVSRQHARITQRNGQFFITDLGATNFTFVNDKKIASNTETAIQPGDVIKLSDEEFVFEG